MSKEAKIGLAFVGVLLLVFTGLLLRRLIATDVAVKPQSQSTSGAESGTNRPRDKPTVVTAQKDRAAQGGQINQNLWSKDEPASEAAAGGPRASFMPAESRLRNRYATDQEPAADEDAESTRATRANPFGREARQVGGDEQPSDDSSDSAPKRLDVTPDGASALEPRQQPTPAVRNPLRRLSVEVPLNEAPSANEIPTTADEPQPAVETEPLSLDEPRGGFQPLDDPRTADPEPAANEPLANEPTANEPTLGEPAVTEPVERPTPPRTAMQSRYDRPAATEQTPANGKYTIQPNDNLWIVSEKVYGTGRYFKAIYEYNRAKLPHADRLTVGTEIAVPPVSELEQKYPLLVPKQRRSAVVKPRAVQPASTRGSVVGGGGGDVYVVEEGDTLFDIARYELGKASRWAEIYDLNREALGDDFNYLQPGTELRMPARPPTTDAVTRQRDSGTRR